MIVPVYNVAPYLRQFMDSLVRQTFQDFDIVAVDDRSTDSSLNILQAYKPVFKERLQIICNRENLGPGGTRNKGLENLPSEGKYILFLDSDDYFENDMLEVLVNTADKNDADITICGMDRVDVYGAQHTKGEMISNPEKVTENLSDCKELAYINTFLVNKLLRRDWAEAISFPAMRRWEEFIYFFEYMTNVSRVKFVNQVLYHYRQRGDSLTGSMDESIYSSALQGLKEEIKAFQKDVNRYERVKSPFEVQVFMRCAVGGVCRMSLKNMKAAPRYVRQMKKYLDETIPGWKKNPYLTLRGASRRKLKENAIMAAALLYKTNQFLLFVWAYWLMKCVLKKDVRY